MPWISSSARDQVRVPSALIYQSLRWLVRRHELGALAAPLRDRFGIVSRLEYYKQEELEFIVTRAADILNIGIEQAGASEIARRSRGTPRIANRLLKRVRDFAQVVGNGVITADIADEALKRLHVDKMGLDRIDRRVLKCIIENYDGGPVGDRNNSGCCQ